VNFALTDDNGNLDVINWLTAIVIHE